MRWKPQPPAQEGLWEALDRYQPTPPVKPSQKLPTRTTAKPATVRRVVDDGPGQTTRMMALKRRIVALMGEGQTYSEARRQAIRELWPEEFES